MARILLLITTLLFLSTATTFSQCAGFQDGFESGNWSPTWSLVNGTYTTAAITTNPAVGIYCLQNTGSGGHLSGYQATFPSGQPSSVSWRVRYNSTSSSGAYFVIGDSTMSASDCVAFCYIQSGSNIRIYNGTGSNTPCTANTWYHIELRNIDYVNRLFDIYIDNVLIQANYAFRSSTISSIDRIYLYNISSMDAYYDEIIVGGSPISLAGSVANVNCAGDSSGSVAVVPGGGTPQYNYLWNTGDTSSSLPNLPAGTYTVMVTDSNGCTAEDSFQVSSPPAIASSIVGTNLTCNGDTSGSVDLSPSGGTAGYTYLWSNGDSTEDLLNLPAGNYTVTLTDSLGCTRLDSVTLTEPTAIAASFSVSNPLCNGDSTGAISLIATGGTPGYSYLWSSGQVTSGISGVLPSSYQVTITDSLGCTGLDSAAIVEPTAISSSGIVTDEVTPPGNNGAIDLAVAGGTPGYSFLWSNNATTEDLNGLASGTYSVMITDSNGCTWTDTFAVSTLVGMENLQHSFGLRAYPNPGSGNFNVVIDQPIASNSLLTLHDMQGRVIRKQHLDLISGENKVQLDLSMEANGIYLLKVQREGESGYLKLLKQ